MTARPVIGITGREITARDLGAPRGFHDAPIAAYFGEYASSVAMAGGIPVYLPMDADPAELGSSLDGLVFAGGDDVDPRLYGEAPGPKTPQIDPRRDAFEIALFRAAEAHAVPVLGICRGAQVINVALGGSLVGDLPIGEGESHASYAYPRAHRTHGVTFTAGSQMSQLYGDSITVNSFHHQAVGRHGEGVMVTGVASDGVVEAYEVAGRAILAVQWHPECFDSDPIFEWLTEAAERRQEAAV